MLLIKLTYPLVITEDIKRLECIIMLYYFFDLELFLFLLLL
jgi:hypothetical protein